MVVYKNKYQIQIPHAIWTLERHWYYAIAILLSHLTFNQGVHKTPRPTDSIIGVVILSFASKSDDANSSSYGAGITSIGGR